VRQITRDWLKNTDDLEVIAEYFQPACDVNSVVGEPSNPKHLHLLITAEESEEDEELAMDAERKDVVPELPLQIMNRRKHRV
jgi:hypothetical protein